MKILVISEAKTVGLATKKVLETLLNDDVVLADHEKALEVFLTEEPNAVLIYDYEEKIMGSKGVGTYRDIKGSATNETILRCGFSQNAYEDYIHLPFLLVDLIKKLKTERR